MFKSKHIFVILSGLLISISAFSKADRYFDKKVTNLICRENSFCSFSLVGVNAPKGSCLTGTFFFNSSTKDGTAMLSMLSTARVANMTVKVWAHDNKCASQGRKVHAVGF